MLTAKQITKRSYHSLFTTTNRLVEKSSSICVKKTFFKKETLHFEGRLTNTRVKAMKNDLFL